jgi:hypothetical protein
MTVKSRRQSTPSQPPRTALLAHQIECGNIVAATVYVALPGGLKICDSAGKTILEAYRTEDHEVLNRTLR